MVNDKVEIIKQVWDSDGLDLQMDITLNPDQLHIEKAMDLFAQQQSKINAIAFANWMEKENTIWCKGKEEPLTDDELYDLFIQYTQSKKTIIKQSIL